MNPRIKYFCQVTIARAYVRVIGAQREPSWIIGDTLLPFLSVAGLVLVYRAMKAPPEYTGFVVLGGVMMTFWASMLWTMGMQLFWEKETGNLARYLMTPMPRPALLLGMALGGVFMAGTRAAMIFVVSKFLFKIEFQMGQPWLALAVFSATMAALYGMGMTVCSLFFMAGRGVNYGLTALFEPSMFLGGFYFPIKSLGMFTAAAAAALIPTTMGLDALRQIVFNARALGFLDPETELGLLLVMGIIFVYLSVWAVGKMEEIGRRHGKLITRES